MKSSGSMSIEVEYGPPASDAEISALARIEGQAFNYPSADSEVWLAAHRSQVRVVRRGERVVGGLLLIPMGQFFGGRRVAMTGIAGVAVAPGERGRGTAKALMTGMLRERRRLGIALSTLYPTTLTLYGRVGYSVAGSRFRMRVPLATLGRIESNGLVVREIEERDARRLEKLYREHAAQRVGWLDRNEQIWERVRRTPRAAELFGYVVEGDAIEGYIYYVQERLAAFRYDLAIRDVLATTPAAARRLLAFLADQRSLAREMVWHGGLDDGLFHSLPELGGEVSVAERWMLRIVDLETALAERGYPADVEARLELQVADEQLRGNRGKWILEVAGGAGTVRAGGRGHLRVDVRALATLYSGQLSAERLASLGSLEGTARRLATASTVFAGMAPSLPDHF